MRQVLPVPGRIATSSTPGFSASSVSSSTGGGTTPVADISASTTSGPAPLEVEFSAEGSSHPGGLQQMSWLLPQQRSPLSAPLS